MLFSDVQLLEQIMLECDPRTDAYWSYSIPLNLGNKPFFFFFDGVDAYVNQCYELCELNSFKKPDEVQLMKYLAAKLADDRCLLVLSLIPEDRKQLLNRITFIEPKLVEKIKAKFITQSLHRPLSISTSVREKKGQDKLKLVFLLDPLDTISMQEQALSKIDELLTAFEDQGINYTAFVLFNKGSNRTLQRRWINFSGPMEGDDLAKFFDCSDVVLSFGRYNQVEIMLEAWRHQTIPVVNERFGLEEAILERGPLLFWPNGAAINTSEKKIINSFVLSITELVSMSYNKDQSMIWAQLSKDDNKYYQHTAFDSFKAASAAILKQKDAFSVPHAMKDLGAKSSLIKLHDNKSVILPLVAVPQPVLNFYGTVINQCGPFLDVKFEGVGNKRLRLNFREMELGNNMDITEYVFRLHFDSLHKMIKLHLVALALSGINKIVFLMRIKKILVMILPPSLVSFIKYLLFYNKKF